MFKVNNKDTRTTPLASNIFNVEYISHLVLVFLWYYYWDKFSYAKICKSDLTSIMIFPMEYLSIWQTSPMADILLARMKLSLSFNPVIRLDNRRSVYWGRNSLHKWHDLTIVSHSFIRNSGLIVDFFSKTF